MTVAVASGKGGTGKTTIAVSLALSREEPGTLLDCDVEEPNAHLFLHPSIEEAHPVELLVPEVDTALCTGCGACSRACRFHAIVTLGTEPLVFPELCHACGGCTLACPTHAIREVPFRIGVVERGRAGALAFAQGRLDVGRAMAVPVIRALRSTAQDGAGFTVIDAPPGTSCPVVASVRGTDVVLLVTEPTPFGLNDLVLAVGMVRSLGIPFGVVINRSDIGDAAVRDYCAGERIPVLLEIAEDRRIAEAYSRGVPALSAVPDLAHRFRALAESLAGLASGRSVAVSA
jgi:MinD superfamily P-loop ATPase